MILDSRFHHGQKILMVLVNILSSATTIREEILDDIMPSTLLPSSVERLLPFMLHALQWRKPNCKTTDRIKETNKVAVA
jgi:hypothetical protein